MFTHRAVGGPPYLSGTHACSSTGPGARACLATAIPGTIAPPQRKGHQYILVYKTFSGFMPLTYRLWLPPTLKMEGRIEPLPAPVPVTGGETGQISLENPRPAALSRIVDGLNPRMGN